MSYPYGQPGQRVVPPPLAVPVPPRPPRPRDHHHTQAVWLWGCALGSFAVAAIAFITALVMDAATSGLNGLACALGDQTSCQEQAVHTIALLVAASMAFAAIVCAAGATYEMWGTRDR
jgi:hypothetical protein